MLTLVNRIYQSIITVASVANAIGTAVIFLLVAIMNFDVIARGVFHAPLRGVFEVVIFSMILIVFLQLPDVVRHNRLTRSDGFLTFAAGRHPAFISVLTRCIDALAAVFMALIAWTVWPEFIESFHTCQFSAAPNSSLWQDLSNGMARCDYFGTPGIFTAPWWPAKLAIALSVSLCAIIFAFKATLENRQPVLVQNGESPV